MKKRRVGFALARYIMNVMLMNEIQNLLLFRHHADVMEISLQKLAELSSMDHLHSAEEKKNW